MTELTAQLERLRAEACKDMRSNELHERAPYYEGVRDGITHALRVLRTVKAAEPETRFKVGDRVTHARERDARGTVTSLTTVYSVQWDAGDGAEDYPDSSELEPAPPELPDDHIDRYWVQGAWIVSPDGDPYVVTSPAAALTLRTNWRQWIHKRANIMPDGETGWSFHPNSPIQQKREP